MTKEMNQRGKTFFFKLGAVEDLGKKLGKNVEKYDQIMETRMNTATNLVWRIAHQRRPYISKQQQKTGFITKSGNMHHNRVSDPNAELGVPVQTGNLQSSIKKQVTRQGYGKFVGEVFVDLAKAPYAKAIEYGTDRIHARPFMRPAIALTREQLHKLFRARAEIK